MKNKYLSRKFLVCIAAMLSSIGTSIAGLHSDNPTVTTIGIVATIVSAAIYAFCEALVDCASINFQKSDPGAAIEVQEDNE